MAPPLTTSGTSSTSPRCLPAPAPNNQAAAATLLYSHCTSDCTCTSWLRHPHSVQQITCPPTHCVLDVLLRARQGPQHCCSPRLLAPNSPRRGVPSGFEPAADSPEARLLLALLLSRPLGARQPVEALPGAGSDAVVPGSRPSPCEGGPGGATFSTNSCARSSSCRQSSTHSTTTSSRRRSEDQEHKRAQGVALVLD
jgi:hypothetical protein